MQKFIKIYYDENRILDEIEEVQEMIDFFKQNKIKYYFPFSLGREPKENEILNKIEKDKKTNNPDKILKKINDFFVKNEKEIIEILENYDKNLKINRVFKVYLSYYGCDGYFYSPDIVVVNIHNNSLDYIIENILHEIVHLLVEEFYKDKKYEEKEKMIDDIIIKSGLKKFLPNYQVQKFE